LPIFFAIAHRSISKSRTPYVNRFNSKDSMTPTPKPKKGLKQPPQISDFEGRLYRGGFKHRHDYPKVWKSIKEDIFTPPLAPTPKTDHRTYAPPFTSLAIPNRVPPRIPVKVKPTDRTRFQHPEFMAPTLKPKIISPQGFYQACGRRKTATANVLLKPNGTGEIRINKRTFSDYFPHFVQRDEILQPFLVSQQLGLFDTIVDVKGGGLSGQAGAIKLGIARALEKFEPELRFVFKDLKLLTRDSRMVERKKTGQPKARMKFQWVKR